MVKTLKLARDLVNTTVDQKTGMVRVSVEMPEAQLSADVLNDIIAEVDDFIRHKQNTSASEQAKWINLRLDEVEGQLRSAENELMSFRERNRRIFDSPDLLLQQDRLARDMQMKSTLYVELKKQYELAKIDEIKSLTIVNVLDKARPPIQKVRPHRLINTGIAFLLGLLLAASYIALRDVYLPLGVTRLNEIMKSGVISN